MSTDEFLIVGLGASAGGIKALKEFFEHVPADSGMAYVVVLHLSPKHDSHLAEVLQVSASIPVTQVRERVRIQPNHVYVVPPNQSLTMLDGHLGVSNLTRIEERRAPVDIFFRTLAESRHSYAACVVLSGTGADGSMGLKRVKELGGICVVQDPNEAEYNDMPRNSIATALVDHVLPVAAIAAKLIAYRNSLATQPIEVEEPHRPAVDEQSLRELFSHLRAGTGHDFSNYRRATVLRQVHRRMGVHQILDLLSYAHVVREQPEEAQALLKDLLISVTNFFRDRVAFESLERIVLPRLFQSKTEDDQLRVWVAGCATGEEAYSLAMLLAEHSAGVPGAPMVQVFATDIDVDAIAMAREGVYTINDAADIPAERLRRFFQKEGDAYRVRKELREMVLFAHHSIIKDPPFSHLDLVSCRNLLIYLNRSAQRRVMEVTHFALNPEAYLFLGSTESIEGFGNLFVVVDKDAHIFQSRATSARISIPIAELAAPNERRVMDQAVQPRTKERLSFADLHLRLLEQYAPPSVVVNEDHEIVHISESAGRFLQFVGGEPTHNLLRVVRPELRLELRTALYRSAQQRTDVTVSDLTVRLDDDTVSVDIIVRPVLHPTDTARGFFLIAFQEHQQGTHDAAAANTIPAPARQIDAARQLEDEMIRLKALLRTTIERHETQAEELKASNEELQAMNEELRSSAEELETSKEELQSLNEEMRTVNQELKIKIEEQVQANDDIYNLINSAEIGTVFLDRSARVKLFTPRTRDIFSLLPVDRGRQLADINNHLLSTDLTAEIDRVLQHQARVEQEVQTRDGRWFVMRLFPYRTAEDHIDGVVLTFFDITVRKLAEEALRRSEERMRLVLESIADHAILTLDEEGHIDTWNAGARAMFGFTESEAGGSSFDLLSTPEDRERGVTAAELRQARVAGRAVDERWHVRKDGTRVFVSGTLSPLRSAHGAIVGYVKIARDLTERRKLEALHHANDDLDSRVQERTRELADANVALDLELRERRGAEERIRKLLNRLVTIQEDERRRVARDLHDHLGQQITALRLTLESLKSGSMVDGRLPETVAEAQRITERLDRDLDFFTSELRPPSLDDLGLGTALAQYVAEWSRNTGVPAQFHSSALDGLQLTSDLEINLYRIAQEGLNNVYKHAQATRVEVFLGRRDGQIVLIVDDNGRGFQPPPPAGETRDREFGLLGIRERAALLGGQVEIETEPGNGTSIFVKVPASFTQPE